MSRRTSKGDLLLPTNEAEWKECIPSLESAKNCMFNRSGFSPAQRQLGHNIRLPASLGSDDPYDPALVLHAAGSEVQRTLKLRHLATHAFVKLTTHIALQKQAEPEAVSPKSSTPKTQAR